MLHTYMYMLRGTYIWHRQANMHALIFACHTLWRMTEVSQQPWGEVPGQGSVDLWILRSPKVQVEVLTLGAIIRSVCSKGRDGRLEDLVLGYDHLEGTALREMNDQI